MYNGVEDLLCNWVGVKYILDNMTWKNGTGFGVRKEYQGEEIADRTSHFFFLEYEN